MISPGEVLTDDREWQRAWHAEWVAVLLDDALTGGSFKELATAGELALTYLLEDIARFQLKLRRISQEVERDAASQGL